MRSRYSGKSFVRAYPMQQQDVFFDGLIWAFAFFGGVFPVIVFDNLKTAVRTVLRGKNRIEQDQLVRFRSYYTFEAWFGNPAIGREDRRTIDERHEEERCRLLPLPSKLFENIKPVQVQISRYQAGGNRYSVPGAYVGRKVWAHINCDRVQICAEGKKIADYPRLLGNNKWQIDPQHYLEIIAERIQAFNGARAMRQWRPIWPAAYETMLLILRKRFGDNK